MNVQLVGKTIGVGKYENLTDEEIISAIARHGIIKEDNGKLVKYLMDHKHVSPLDMINYVFEIETSRAIGRQILRHSSIKFQEHSQRYSNKISFQPIEIRQEHPTNRQSSTDVFDPELEEYGWSYEEDFPNLDPLASQAITHHLERVEFLYNQLLQAGVAKECARFILPECATSILSANGTLRSWLSFLNVRLNEHSQKECRLIAEEILKILKVQLPNVFSQIDTDNGLFL